MNSLEKTYIELNKSIGVWKEPESPMDLDLPDDPPLPWSELLREYREMLEPVGRRGLDGSVSNESLSDEERGRLGGGIQQHGFEALAFYKSFRYRSNKPGEDKWGIFYLAKGLQFVEELIDHYTGSGVQASGLAHKFLKAHEMYHFSVDAVALTVEPPLSKHLYLPYRRAYRRYSLHCVEEALANRKAWAWAENENRQFSGLLEFAEDFMDSQPNAYSRYCEDPIVLGSELAENLISQNFGKGGSSHLANWANEMPSKFSYRVPEYIIPHVCPSDFVSKALIIPKVDEIDDSKLASGLPSELKRKWERTKDKLLSCPALRGLNFKPWKPPGVWSVRVDKGYRAHLEYSSEGKWKAIEIGTHDKMGH